MNKEYIYKLGNDKSDKCAEKKSSKLCEEIRKRYRKSDHASRDDRRIDDSLKNNITCSGSYINRNNKRNHKSHGNNYQIITDKAYDRIVRLGRHQHSGHTAYYVSYQQKERINMSHAVTENSTHNDVKYKSVQYNTAKNHVICSDIHFLCVRRQDHPLLTPLLHKTAHISPP